MIELLVQGGLTFTIPLTFIAVFVLFVSIRAVTFRFTVHTTEDRWRGVLFHVGLFALILGILSQAVGLYQMMQAIEQVGNVPPALVAGGLRVSLIAPIYGLLIFAFAMVVWFVTGQWPARKQGSVE